MRDRVLAMAVDKDSGRIVREGGGEKDLRFAVLLIDRPAKSDHAETGQPFETRQVDDHCKPAARLAACIRC